MMQLSNGVAFKPREAAVGRRWGILIVTPSGDTNLEVSPNGQDNWKLLATFSEAGAHLDELSVDRFYRVNTDAAAEVWLI